MALPRAFTLIELLVVILIIVIVSAITLPTVLPAIGHRQVGEAARLLQAALAGARDNAIHNHAPSGIRLLPDPALQSLVTDPNRPGYGYLDPTQILAANRIIPIDPAPDYAEGLVNVGRVADATPATWTLPGGLPPPYPGPGGGVYPVNGAVPNPPPPAIPTWVPPANVLMIEESIGTVQLLDTETGPKRILVANSPTSWYWNIRVGDRLQVNQSGPWYTVVGPMTVPPAGGNTEMFVNVGAPGTPPPLQRTYTTDLGEITATPEFLFLVDGRDDNGNGWVDEGWDGVDNNGNGQIDELAEWQPAATVDPLTGHVNVMPAEAETWTGSVATRGIANLAYAIRRRPAPSVNAREIALPSGVVIDLTSWGLTRERSRLPVGAFNVYTGAVDILLNPDGTVVPSTIYSSPSSLGIDAAFYHFWLAERGDLQPVLLRTDGNPAPLATGQSFLLPIVQGTVPYDGPYLKGEYRLVTLFARSGAIASAENMPFVDPLRGQYDVNAPYRQSQQGVNGQ